MIEPSIHQFSSYPYTNCRTLSIHLQSHCVRLQLFTLCLFTNNHNLSIRQKSQGHTSIVTMCIQQQITLSMHQIVTHCLFTIVTHYLFTNSHTAQWDLQLDILLIKQYAHFVQTQMVTFLFTNIVTLRQSIKQKHHVVLFCSSNQQSYTVFALIVTLCPLKKQSHHVNPFILQLCLYKLQFTISNPKSHNVYPLIVTNCPSKPKYQSVYPIYNFSP